MCLNESIIIFLSLIRIILLCFPISSIIRLFISISLNSFIVSILIFTNLSNPYISIVEILPLIKCFLSNIQKFGATRGFSFEFVVRFILQLCASIHIFNA